MAGDPDAIVIGSGPNGLVAACMLARAGLRVLVCEANPRRWGGALGSEEATLPGFVHDVGAAFFPFPRISPAFRALELEKHVELCFAEFESCHPAPDGSVACISRDLDVCARNFGDPRDGETFAALARWYRGVEPAVLGILLNTLPTIAPVLKLLPFGIFKLARILLSSGGGLARRLFRGEAARRVMPGLALHVDVGPRDPLGAALGFMLGMTATTGGYSIRAAEPRRWPTRWSPTCGATAARSASPAASTGSSRKVAGPSASASPTAPSCAPPVAPCSPTPPPRRSCSTWSSATSCPGAWSASWRSSRRAGAPSRSTGRCRRRSRGLSPRPGAPRSSTPATASPTSSGSPPRSVAVNSPTTRTSSSASRPSPTRRAPRPASTRCGHTRACRAARRRLAGPRRGLRRPRRRPHRGPRARLPQHRAGAPDRRPT
ncbi:NAD(P)-binding protein [Nannocystis pusilla]|uniref:phytoene desaturase family protein n=1 Tax=Nannocystis pusilla TaxID=889268 RepID=UPI003B81DFBE